MTDTKIDHVAEAQICITAAHRDNPDDMFTMLQAQVHATLALAEQTRIANLIAAAQMEGGPYRDANNWTVGDEDANVVIRRDIREGLGLS